MIHRPLRFSTFVLACLACACGKGDESDPFDDGALVAMAILKATDLEVKNTKVLAPEEVEAEVNDLDELYANEPKSNEPGEPEEDVEFSSCFKKVLDGAKLAVEGNSMKISYVSKGFKCKSGQLGEVSVTAYDFLAATQCEELEPEMRKLDGMTVAQAMKAGPTIRGCVKGKEEGVTDGCVQTTITKSEATVDGKTRKEAEKTVLRSSGLKESEDGQRFFDEGVFELSLADWNGKVTYSGKSKAPAWELKKGKAAKKGTFRGKEAAKAALDLDAMGRDLGKTIRRHAYALGTGGPGGSRSE